MSLGLLHPTHAVSIKEHFAGRERAIQAASDKDQLRRLFNALDREQRKQKAVELDEKLSAIFSDATEDGQWMRCHYGIWSHVDGRRLCGMNHELSKTIWGRHADPAEML